MKSPRKATLIIYQNGSQTRAVDQHAALVLWYMTLENDRSFLPKKPEVLKLYRGSTVRFHEGEQFIDQMIACVERHYGLTPQVKHYKSHLLKCQMLLEFLREHGNIRELHFADSTNELPPFDWRDLPKL